VQESDSDLERVSEVVECCLLIFAPNLSKKEIQLESCACLDYNPSQADVRISRP
jgi:hypothetical protein